MKAQIILSRSFSFEAAHSISLPDGTDPGYKRLHGHSFAGKIMVRGDKAKIDKWLLDFGSLDPVIDKIRAHLDHAYLNDIDGLKYSTMENLCAWIFNLIKEDVSLLYGIELARPTCGQVCTLTVDD